MKAGIYKCRDDGKHIYVSKDRTIRAHELTDVHTTVNGVKVSTSEKEQVVTITLPGGGKNVIADRVADVPNGTTDHAQALQHYVRYVAPMPAGVFVTPNDTLVYVDENHVIQATSLRPSTWLGETVGYCSTVQKILLCGYYTCRHYADALPDMDPQEQIDLLAQSMPQPGSTRAVTPMTMPTPQELRSDVYLSEPGVEPNVSHLFPGTALHSAKWEEPTATPLEDIATACAKSGTLAALVPKPLTADEMREMLGRSRERWEKLCEKHPAAVSPGTVAAIGAIRMSAEAAAREVQEYKAVQMMVTSNSDLVAKGIIKHVASDEYEILDMDAYRAYMIEIYPGQADFYRRLGAKRPSDGARYVSPLVEADFAKLEERVIGMPPELGAPYEGDRRYWVVPNHNDQGWYAEALAATHPRRVGKQSARKHRKKGRRVWWDAERNTRVWAPK